jgi:lipoteichoic acid synthase
VNFLLSVKNAARQTFPMALSLLAVLVVVKVYKSVFAVWPIADTLFWVRPTLIQAVFLLVKSPLFIAAILACAAVIWWRITAQNMKLRWTPIGVGVGLLVLAKLIMVVRSGDWSGLTNSWTLYKAQAQLHHVGSMLTADIGTAAAFWMAATLIMLPADRLRKVAVSLLIFVTVILELIVSIEFAHYLKTGIGGTADLLLHFARNAGNLWLIVNSEVDGKSLFAISAPLAVGLAAYFLGKWLTQNIKLDRRKGLAAAPAAWISMCATAAIPFQLPDPDLMRIQGNAILNIAHDVAIVHFMEHSVVEASGEELRVARNTGGARLTAPADARKMNIIVVMLESVRAESTTIYSPQLGTTPFLAELAKNSALVEEMYAVIPRTMSSWMATLAGIHPSTDPLLIAWGARSSTEHEKLTSLPRLLKPLGYRSAFFVPGSLQFAREGNIIQALGFDHIVDVDDLESTGFEKVNYFGLEDRALLSPVNEWLDETSGGGDPFLLVVMTNTTHHEYGVPSHWPQVQFKPDAREDEARYLNAIAYSDDFVRRLYSDLQRKNLMDNSILIVMGDHGQAFGEHGADAMHSYTLFQNTMHVPMLIHAPSLFAEPIRIHGPRQQIDFIPTIVDLAGWQLENVELPGVPLSSPPDPDRTIYFSSSTERMSAAILRSGRKFIYHFGRQPMEVYDIKADPAERENQAGAYTEDERRRIESLLWSWSTAVKTTFR